MVKKYDYVCRDNLNGVLKGNLWKKSNEVFCWGLLRTYFYPKFESFTHSDSPDLIDNKNQIGIEVCKAIKEEDAQTLGEFIRLGSCDNNQYNKSLKIIKDNGCDYYSDNLSWGARSENDFLKRFREIVSKKLKLVDKYLTRGIKTIGLIVYCETSIINDYSKDFADAYKELIDGKRGYDFIYFIFCYGIYYYEPFTGVLKTVEVQHDDFEYIHLLARFIAEGKIKFEDNEWSNLIQK